MKMLLIFLKKVASKKHKENSLDIYSVFIIQTLCKIHPSPQVIQVGLPDLHIVCCLNKTCIQSFFKHFWKKNGEKTKLLSLYCEN